MAINFTPLQNSGYRQLPDQEIQFGDRKTYRYILENSNLLDAAATAINALLAANPDLLFVSKPQPSENLQDLVRNYPYLVVNKNVLCLSDKPQAPRNVRITCKDIFFSGSIIEQPIQCVSGKHTFEKRHIEGWVRLKGDLCPNGQHQVGSLEVDPAVSEEIRGLLNKDKKIKRVEDSQYNDEKCIHQLEQLETKKSTLTITWPNNRLTNTFFQLTDPRQSLLPQGDNLTSEEIQQLLRRIVCDLPIEKLNQIISRIPMRYVEKMLTYLRVDETKSSRLMEKLQLLRAFNTPRQTHSPFKTIIDFFHHIEAAISDFIPDHNPANPWEAQQMLTLMTTATVGIYGVGMTAGPAGLAAIAGAVGAYATYKYFSDDLPEDLPPCTNLTLGARSKQSYPLIGRDDVIEQVFECWKGTNSTVRQHPLLVGPPGVGKTIIMEEIARRIAFFPEQLEIPESLKKGAVFGCTAAQLLPSNTFEGDEKLERFLRRVRNVQERAIIAIDEIHTFMNEAQEGNYSERIKSVLDTRGPPYMLFATTDAEYEKYIAKDASLARRFHKIPVEQLDKNHTIAILKQQLIMEFPNALFEPTILSYIVDKSDELTRKDAKFKQPEVAKQVLLRVLSRIKRDVPQSYKLLKEKKGERERLQSFLSYDMSLTPAQENVMLKIKLVDREIANYEYKVKEEEEKTRLYKEVINKIIGSMSFIINLTKSKKHFSGEETKQFKLLSYIFIPELVSMKRELEKELNMKPLSKEIIDSVIADFH